MSARQAGKREVNRLALEAAVNAGCVVAFADANGMRLYEKTSSGAVKVMPVKRAKLSQDVVTDSLMKYGSY